MRFERKKEEFCSVHLGETVVSVVAWLNLENAIIKNVTLKDSGQECQIMENGWIYDEHSGMEFSCWNSWINYIKEKE